MLRICTFTGKDGLAGVSYFDLAFLRDLRESFASLPAFCLIAQSLRECPSLRDFASSQIVARAHALAGALSLMSWWLDHYASASPEQMDDLFHQIVWSGVEVSSTIPLRRLG